MPEVFLVIVNKHFYYACLIHENFSVFLTLVLWLNKRFMVKGKTRPYLLQRQLVY